MSLSTPNSLPRMTKRRGVTRSQIRKLPSVYPDVQTFKFQVRRPQLCDRIVGHGAPLKAAFALSARSPEAAKNGGEGGIRTCLKRLRFSFVSRVTLQASLHQESDAKHNRPIASL